MKKGKITEVEISCLKGMAMDNVSAEGMAKQLNRSVEAIQKELDRISDKVLRDQMLITKTAGGVPGVAVMTKAGSLRADENKNEPPSTTIPRKGDRAEWVHKIRPDEE
jgi:bisphosphoglycerate-independent phosphoglycerate mutase (AlkP superfamily)